MHKRTLSTVVGLLALVAVASMAHAMPAPDANSVLILDESVSGGLGSNEATTAAGNGFTPVVVTDAQWAAMTAPEFATYRALVLGDATCGGVGTGSFIDAAIANRAVWSAVVNGNIIINGTDPVYHQGQGGITMTDAGIAFAGDIATKTGLYVSLSCYYHGTAPGTPIPVLDQFGAFSVTGVGCYNSAHIVAAHPALAGMTDASLSNWSCSVHEAFDGFPGAFLPLVIANGISTGAINFPDGSSGPPYVLARGEAVIPVECGNGLLQAPEECDDGNIVGGDGCSPQCKLEVCGNAILDAGEECDDGNIANGDGCSSGCTIEPAQVCGNAILEAPEQCDDGNVVSGDGCSALCVPEFCGDNIVNNINETCDDGNVVSGDGCNAQCELEVCGDGVINNNGTEACDDGNIVSGDGCSNLCVVEFCGDGIVNNVTETCDDGNNVSADGCSAICQAEQHHLCYGIKHSDDPQFGGTSIALADLVYPVGRNFTVKRPKRFCNPVEKVHNGNIFPIVDPDDHAATYPIQPSGEPAFVRTSAQVSNQFGNQVLSLVREDSVWVPTQVLGDPAATDNHYKCYRVKSKFPRLTVTTSDPFFGILSQQTVVRSASELCLAAEKTHNGVVTPKMDPSRHLVCYDIRQPGADVNTAVAYLNQFEGTTVSPRRSSCAVPGRLCVPSVVSIP